MHSNESMERPSERTVVWIVVLAAAIALAAAASLDAQEWTAPRGASRWAQPTGPTSAARTALRSSLPLALRGRPGETR